jgi:long-chain acyl-CoA synthetase
MSGRPFPWEKSYPAGLDWGTPIRTSTIPELFEAAVERFGKRPAIEFNDVEIRYAEIKEQVAQVAAGLTAMGVAPGVSVALYLPNVPYHPISFFAVLHAGGRVVHLSPLDALRMLRFKLEDSEARILITVNLPPLLQNAEQLLAQGLIDHLIVGEIERFGGHPAALPLPGDAVPFTRLLEAPPMASHSSLTEQDVAVLQYTGGTTGLPKAAMLTHANLTAAVSMYETWANATGRAVDEKDSVACYLPLFHIYGLTAVFLTAFHRGAKLLLRLRFDAESALRDIEIKRATFFPGVPTMWIALASHPDISKRDLSSLRSISSGGAPLPTEVAEKLEHLTGHRLGGGWGMTETSPAGTNLLPGQANAPGLIGLPLPGIEMQVVALDNPRKILPSGEKGEFRIRGLNITPGYWKRPEENKTAFVDGYFLTGDVGYMDENGFFYLVDRKKDMIISGGFNVYPTVIEQAIYEHPSVEEVIVIGIPDAYRGEVAKAFIKLHEGAKEFSLEELQAFLADKLGRHEIPAALELRSMLPKTPVGKLSRKELVEEERARLKKSLAM